MSYTNPTATEISSIGLDSVITELQVLLKAIPWLDKCFHRAYTHRELDTAGRIVVIPKVWEAENEWYDCRPNDAVISQAFFVPVSPERILSFEKNSDPTFEQDIAIIFWLNIDQIETHDTGPSLGYEKATVLDVLKAANAVSNIDSIVDRSATEIYEGFTISDEKTNYTMLPFAGFRINLTVKFDYIECLDPSS